MKNRSQRKNGGAWRWTMALVLVLLCGTIAPVALSADDAVPEALEAWKGWVLHGQNAWLCPEIAGERDGEFCAWPGELKLEVGKGTARFSQVWQMQREGAALLPGNREYWPEQVMVGGEAYPVLARDGAPVVWLPPGEHELSGLISWTERPRTLAIPEKVALVSLTVDGRDVFPERHGASLVLGGTGTPAREEDSLDLQVYRRLADGIPARLMTQVRLKVSGKARELDVPDILPARFAPVNIVSPWTVRLDQDGHLKVQAMPGQAVVEIEARLDGPLQDIAPGLSPERPQEVWSYQDAPALRATTIAPDDDGRMIAVDPRQAGVPEAWSALPAFVVNEGARFTVEERSRGQSERENQRLMLQREMWLDFSGAGFFTRDRIEGAMRQGWRFDVARPYTLERADGLLSPAASRDSRAALLVTKGASEELTGVEWRQPQVTLNAGVRLAADANARIPVTGWRQSFDSVDAVLHLPYGYRLVAAPGADNVSPNVWIERWTILDIFLAAFFALLAWRLLGATGGLVTAAYLTLAMHESFAPVHSFAVVVVLALLCRSVPEGRLRRWFLAGERLALIGLVTMAALFLPAQLRYAFYPQLEGNAPIVTREFKPAQTDRVDVLDEAAVEMDAAPLAFESSAPKAARNQDVARAPAMASQSGGASAKRQRYAQSTVTQTGGGEPAWNIGERYRLRWSGPVAETQSVRLIISPQWLTRCLRVLMAALLGFLLWRLIRTAFPRSAPPLALPGSRAAPAVPLACLAFLLAAFSLCFPAPAAASEFPSAQLLSELKERLLEAPECAPNCVDVAQARVDAEGNALRVTLTAHVAEAWSLALPEPDEHLFPRAVRVDGEARPVLRFEEKSYVALPRGIHRIELEYAANGDTAALSFPLRPARIEFAGAGWQVEGIDQNRLLSETLNFSRAAPVLPAGAAANASPERAAQPFPPFVQVTRHLDLDLDWSVHTQVARIAPAEGGFTFPVPLLPGEHVTSPEVKVQDGRALAVFTAGAGIASWTARLDKARTIELTAPPLSERAETWRVTVSPSWHLEWSGVPVTLPGSREGVVFEFHPLPGEKLALTLTQPLKTDGGVRAIDRVRLESSIGRHAGDHVLEFRLRASQAGEHRITLPAGLEVLDVRRDGVPLNLQERENRVSLPVSPGTGDYMLRLREQEKIGWSSATPAIDLDLPLANIDLRAKLGEERWVLATRGPAVGPAVLYWGELAVALLVALLLAKSGWSSLRPWQWFLFVLGFSTFSWLALLLLALWLIVIDWRARSASCANWPALKFNAMQTGIAALTVVTAITLIDAVSKGLLGVPGMGIRGYRSSAGNLNWFADQSGPQLPVAEIFSLPIWTYRVLMLAWALWLAYIFIRCLGRGLSAWLRNGYWKKIWRTGKKPKEAMSAAIETTGDQK